MFPCENCKILKNSFIYKSPPVAASELKENKLKERMIYFNYLTDYTKLLSLLRDSKHNAKQQRYRNTKKPNE